MARIFSRPELELIEFHGMVTVAPSMLALFELTKRVARTDSSVLIRGETGTGKELVAAAIHALGHRADGPFRAVNCATFTTELLASELFGHVRGSFTGAVADRPGLFALADKGTVFLDEVAELPLDLQARLLRVVQERSFVPVGATEAVSVDTRILAATNKALRREVAEGRFREDLMYRLRVVPLFLPRLAEREGDVEALFWRFIDEFNQSRGNRAIDAISGAARDAILDYPWPGNVRELRNQVEYAFAVGEGPLFDVSDLTPELRGEGPAVPQNEMTAEDMERKKIISALESSGGQKSKAAELLGMSRSTLWRKIRELHIH